ncbi:MAG: hypothetical protein AAFX94_19310 [Myxococcota bacterium]
MPRQDDWAMLLGSLKQPDEFGQDLADGPVRYQLEKPPGKKLTLQKKERDGSYGRAKRVLDLQVIGREGDRIEASAVVGTPRNNEELSLFLPIDGLAFRNDGRVYHQLREDGVDLERPDVLQSLSKW